MIIQCFSAVLTYFGGIHWIDGCMDYVAKQRSHVVAHALPMRQHGSIIQIQVSFLHQFSHDVLGDTSPSMQTT